MAERHPVAEPDEAHEYAYSWRREVLAMLWACFLAGVCFVALFYAIPFIAVVAGGQ